MMVLSRKANDQNRTILVIYSNHPPTNFGIITNRNDSGRYSFEYLPPLFYVISALQYVDISRSYGMPKAFVPYGS